MSDINMLAVTGGKERSEAEWKTLLEAAGFNLRQVHSVRDDTGTPENISIVEAEPI
jgi:hypothetical protein